MKISRIKAVTMIAVIMMLTSTLTIFATIQSAKASTISTHGFISAVPNPVGVGQTTNIYFWLAETIQNPSAGVGNNNRFRNYTLTIIEPDGTMMPPQDDLARALNVSVAFPYVFDTTSSNSYSFTPAVTGEYTMIFQYKGQGNYYAPGVIGNNFYLPSNQAVATLFVQDEPIPVASGSFPLPEEYWTRPINDENVDWYKISSNWLNSVRDRNQGGIENNRFQPDGIAPNTAHVMWANPLVGQAESSPGINLYQNPPFSTQFIMQGRLYIPLPNNGWRIADLRSGETIYEVTSNSNTPTFAYYRDSDHYNQHGVMWGGVLYAINQTSPTTQDWFAYKPGNPSGAGGAFNLTGAIPFANTWNYTNIPMGYEMIDTKGATLRALVANANNITHPNWHVRLWNDSLGLSGDGTPSTTTPINGATRFIVDVPILSSSLNPIVLQSDTVPVSAKVYYTEFYPYRVTGGVLLCRNGTLPTQTTNTTSQYTYFAISMYNQTIGGSQYREGQLIWMKSYESAANAGITLLQGPSYYSDGFTPDALEGAVWTMVEKETGKWIGYSIFNGDKIWESEPQTTFSPYGYTQPTKNTGATVSVAYGKLFTTGDSGMVFCYDIQTGELLWRYEAPVSYSATVTHYPTHIGAIADNKIYLGTYPLADSTTLLSGSLIRALNVTDGTEIWTMPGFGGPGGFAISDGYMALLNYYDLKVYSIRRVQVLLQLLLLHQELHTWARKC